MDFVIGCVLFGMMGERLFLFYAECDWFGGWRG